MMKIQKILLLLCSSLLFSVAAMAQYNVTQDVVYLKDGSVLRGERIPMDNEGTFKVRILGGSELVVKMEDVDSIVVEKVDPKLLQLDSGRRGLLSHRTRTKQKGGYQFMFEHSWHFKRLDRWGGLTMGTSLRIVNGYRFPFRLTVGGGIGWDVMEGWNAADYFIPIYAHVSYDLLDKIRTPYVYMNTGYGIGVNRSWNTDAQPSFKGGANLGWGAGIKFNYQSNFAFKLGFGYSIQWSEREIQDWWTGGFNTENRRMHYWNLHWGFSF